MNITNEIMHTKNQIEYATELLELATGMVKDMREAWNDTPTEDISMYEEVK